MSRLKKLIKSSLGSLDIGVTRLSTLEKLKQNAAAAHDLRVLSAFPNEHAARLLRSLPHSHSQYRQDLFVLSQLNFKTNGYFVEFGATNGVDLSNTYLLEKEFGWTGILAEPARCWHDDLKANRGAVVETRCVWKASKSVVRFNEVLAPELSTIDAFSEHDLYRKNRRTGKTYDVATISLNDLLAEHRAPETIDYLSVDTEGSEFEILSNFDFCRHTFRVITCEHNFAPTRARIFELLTGHGYVRRYEELSAVDDWYVRSE
jgi:FkbM family methyltransferase